MITKKYYKLVKVSYEDSGYFYVENISNQTGTFTMKSPYNDFTLHYGEYSTDGVNWITPQLEGGEYLELSVPAGGRVYLKGDNDYYMDQQYRPTINMDVDHIAGGNAMSLLDKTNFATKTTINYGNALALLFKNDTHLVSAEKLILPATALAEYCYDSMFYGCTSLTSAPELPAVTLANYCYKEMFRGCTSLTKAPSALPATTVPMYSYSRMFQGCTALTTAPELGFTTVSNYGCNFTFMSCSNLISVKITDTDWDTSTCSDWLNGVAASGTIYAPTGSDIANYSGTSGVPSGWTVVYY